MRTDMKPRVDPQLEEIYMKILIEKLEKPEEWKVCNEYDMTFNSTTISGTKTYFRTAGKDSDGYILDKVIIRSGNYDTMIHTLPINTRRVRRSLRKLYEYMKLKNEWKQYEDIDDNLKKGLPENIDRYLKLTKIRGKL